MSDKNLDIQLSHVEIPDDLLTETLGSNYGLDGYPDMNYGMGTLEGVLDPEFTEAPALPTGLAKAGAEGMNLMAMMREELTNLDWLDPTQLQDPERFPKPSYQTVIPELEEAWSVGLETDGRGIRERDLTTARYEESLTQDVPKKRKATATQMRNVVAHAMRRSAAGQDIDVIVKEALESMGEEMNRVASVLRFVREEHGLAGNVFIRASAYPGYETGKWSKALRKTGARYVIVTQDQMRSATWIQNGRCTYTGKIAVPEVPWKKALDYYKPRLELVGRKVGSGDPLVTLRAAFLSLPEKKVAEGWYPQHSEMTREGFLENPEVRDLETPEARRAQGQLTEAHAQITRWAREGFFSEGARDKILQAPVFPQRKVRAAVKLIQRAKTRAFSGSTNRAAEGSRRLLDARLQGSSKRVSERQQILDDRADQKRAADQERASRPDREMDRALRQANEWLRKNPFSGAPNQGQAGDTLAREARQEAKKEHTARAQAAWDQRVEEQTQKEAKQAALRVIKAIKSGLRGHLLQQAIGRMVPADVRGITAKYINPILQKTGALNEPEGPATYKGVKFERHVAQKKASSPLFQEVQGALKYARQAMSEGFAGQDLDALLSRRFPEQILTAMEGPFKELRAVHEGGAGFIYVDADAYASPSGVTGCEKGALKHRANQIPAVTQMSRCVSCTLVRTLEDGTRKCGVYNKVLLDDTTGPEMDQMRRANLKVSNMSEGEQIGSMFAQTYDPNEFGLRNSNLDGDIPEAVEYAELDVSFGGWDLP